MEVHQGGSPIEDVSTAVMVGGGARPSFRCLDARGGPSPRCDSLRASGRVGAGRSRSTWMGHGLQVVYLEDHEVAAAAAWAKIWGARSPSSSRPGVSTGAPLEAERERHSRDRREETPP